MYKAHRWRSDSRCVLVALLMLVPVLLQSVVAAPPGQSILPVLEERFGLSEQQVRDALGALLVFTRERLPKSDFDDLAKTVPNAELIMQQVKLRGIVSKPLDDINEYEAALVNIGLPPVQAVEFAPAVLEVLHATGHDRERDILARALN